MIKSFIAAGFAALEAPCIDILAPTKKRMKKSNFGLRRGTIMDKSVFLVHGGSPAEILQLSLIEPCLYRSRTCTGVNQLKTDKKRHFNP